MAFEDKGLRRIFGRRTEKVVSEWKILCNRRLHKYCTSPSIMIKSRRMKWAGHVAHMKLTRNTCNVFFENLEGKTTPKT
jgi:hypothetical protein